MGFELANRKKISMGNHIGNVDHIRYSDSATGQFKNNITYALAINSAAGCLNGLGRNLAVGDEVALVSGVMIRGPTIKHPPCVARSRLKLKTHHT